MPAEAVPLAGLRDLVPVCSRLGSATAEQMIGATRVISRAGGRLSQKRLAGALRFNDEKTVGVIEFLSFLGLVDAIGSEVRLTDDGKAIASSGLPERRRLFAELAMRLPIIREITEALAGQPTRSLPRSTLLEALGAQSCPLDADSVFDHVVAWGRYAGLFSFDAKTGQVTLL